MEKKMKRLLTVLIAALLLVPAFAQTTVDEGKLVKTLEKKTLILSMQKISVIIEKCY